MANPSLQIGNSNWAIKKDNLLGYSTAGTRFLPIPITMTRASAGTRVNPQGLVETVELLGSELTSPLNFLSTWLEASVDSKTYNTFTVGGSGRGMYFMLPENKTLKINVSGVTGSVELRYRTTAGGAGTVLGDFDTDLYLTTTNATTNIYLRATGVGTVSVTDVSVKESTKNDLARVDYTGSTSSLLAEPQRRNLVTYSEVISNLSLLTGGAGTYTITDNYTDSPEGVQNASRVQMSIVDTNDGANYSLIASNSSMTTGVTREISFYAKSLTGLNQEVLVYWSTAKQIVTLTNDWQRFEISGTSDNSGAVLIGTRGGTTQYYAGGDANLDFALWGLQVEDDGSGGGSSYATSYIPTDGGTVTRVQDQYTKTGISDKINSEEGVLFVEIARNSNEGAIGGIQINDGSDNNNLRLFFNQSNTISVITRVGGSNNVIKTAQSITSSTAMNKFALMWKLNDYKLYYNGSELWSDTSASVYPTGTLNNLEFKNQPTPFEGKVKQLQVFKTALTDSELATLTTI